MTGATLLFDRSGNRKYLNAKERRRFYEAALCLADPGQKCFALTLFHTGCRISEALELTLARVDLAEGLVVFRTLKQRGKLKHRAIPIPNDLLVALRQQAAQFAPDELLWSFCRTTGWKIIKKCMSDAKLGGVKATPKGLRHGYAIACVSAEIPLPILQRWLGHSSLQTTGIYLDFVGDDERDLASKVWIGLSAAEIET
jgi:integrase